MYQYELFDLQIKVSSVDEGFEFTNYICSLMVPVSIILREVSQDTIYTGGFNLIFVVNFLCLSTYLLH